MPDQEPIPGAIVKDIVAKARQIHDASPTDRAGDHPTASLAIQMWMLEETQRAAKEQHEANEKAAREQQEETKKLLAQNGSLIKWTLISAIAAILSAGAAIWSVWGSEAIAFGQQRPLIDVTPLSVGQLEGTTVTTIYFGIANYSGFDAEKIGIDVKMEDRFWISEWLKARADKNEKGDSAGVAKGKVYFSSPRIDFPSLKKRGEVTFSYVANAMDLESVCSLGDKGAPILIRTTWASKSGHVFDEIAKYTLLCTKDTEGKKIGSGRSFTFLPGGKVSEKG